MQREHGVDRVRALAALCVVLIHCHTMHFHGRPDLMQRAFLILTEWAVPAFFFLGGYVRARTTPYPPGTTRRWMVRLLPAYLLASALALLFRSLVQQQKLDSHDIAVAILTGSAWGIYYFVPLFLGVLLFSHVLARRPSWTPWFCAVSVIGLVVTRWDEGLDPFGRAFGLHGVLRSPLFWWGFFFSGWFVRRRIAQGTSRGRLFLLSAIGVLLSAIVLLLDLPQPATAAARVASSLAIPAAILFASSRPLGFATALIGEYSYEIYLFHYFVVAMALEWSSSGGLAGTAAIWAVAVAVGLAAGVATRQALERPLRRLA